MPQNYKLFLSTQAITHCGITLFYTQFSNNSDNEIVTYQMKIEKQRNEKDNYLKTNASSPLTFENKSNFNGLNYCPIDSQYLTKAFFIGIKDTTNCPPNLIPKGKLKFKLFESEFYLTVYQLGEKLNGRLFIPFLDLTNGAETYGGGRFIDAILEMNNIVYLDFNYSYNPYCAYNHNFICPIPPHQNKLPLKILAVQKNFIDL